MRGLTTYVHISESALRILAEVGYDTDQQAAAFGVSPVTVWRRRLEYGIAGPKERKHSLAAGVGDLPRHPQGRNPLNQAPVASSSGGQLGGL